MSISDTTETAVLELIFNGKSWGNYAINASSSPQTVISFGMHSADPGDSGTMTTTEIAYTSYARVDVARTSTSLAVTGNSVSPVASVTFPAGTGGSGTITHFSTGKSGGGATAILWSGTVTPNIVTGSGITPSLTTASTITLD